MTRLLEALPERNARRLKADHPDPGAKASMLLLVLYLSLSGS